ncbi:MAG TPA: DUF3300 domain-containing protein [Nitrospirota bacterium]|nr:DUF3300 domain-containing protein [Nitrospirota bacterium]
MNSTLIKGFLLAFLLFLSTFLSIQARAQDTDLSYSSSFTDQELEDLLAPVALYPDPLLAQILPASTYPMEVADAAAWLNSGGDVSIVDEQNWADSVKAIAHYPNILQMMAANMDWTANLGDAFLNQPEDVANSIQRLRWRARSVGNLVSNNEQTVIIQGDYIQIVPTQPQYVYVPQYDPSVVYIEEPIPSGPPFITFGYGLAIGGWLSMDFDWGHHHVIYHGWDRPGWVNNARPYVHVRNVYIDRSRPYVNQTWIHDRSHGGPASYLASHPSGPNAEWHMRTGEVEGRTAIQPRPAGGMFGPRGDTYAYSSRGRESRGIAGTPPEPVNPGVSPRPNVPAPAFGQQPSVPPSDLREQRTTPTPETGQQPTSATPRVSSSPSSQPGRTPSVAFGGYRGANEAREQSLRGQASRQSAERMRPTGSAEGHARAPAGGNAPTGRPR